MDKQPQTHFENVPHLILVTGETIRRLHTFAMLVKELSELGKEVHSFTSTYTGKQLKRLQQNHKQVPYDIFKVNKVKKAINDSVTGKKKVDFIIVEALTRDVLLNNLLSLPVKTMIFSDLRARTNMEAQEAASMLLASMKKNPTLQRVLVNADTTLKKYEGFQPSYIEIKPTEKVDMVHYGRSELAGIRFTPEEDTLTIDSVGDQYKHDVPSLKDYSLLKKEGLFAALSFLYKEELLEQAQLWDIDSVPFLENHSGDDEQFVWTEGLNYPDELKELIHISKYKNVCIGLTNYLRFEEVIESDIHLFDTLLVVAENDTQAELLGDYFLNKEKGSYHSIIFVPDRTEMRTALQRIFRSQNKPILYLFDNISTFQNIYQ